MDEDVRERVVLSEGKTAEYLGVSPSTLRSWRSQLKGPKFVRLGSRIGYPTSEIDQFIRANLVSTEP